MLATAASNANLPLITTHLTDSLKGDGNIAVRLLVSHGLGVIPIYNVC